MRDGSLGSGRNQNTFLDYPFLEPSPLHEEETVRVFRPVGSHGGRPENLSCRGFSLPLEKGHVMALSFTVGVLGAHLTGATPTKSQTFWTMRSAPRGNGKARRLSIMESKRMWAGRSFSGEPSNSSEPRRFPT